MAADGHEVTLGEVYRGIQRLDAHLERIATDMVGRGEYEADQESIAARFAHHDQALAEWKHQSTAAHVDLGGRIDGLSSRMHDAEKAQKENRSKWTLAIVIAVVSPVATFLVNLMLRGG